MWCSMSAARSIAVACLLCIPLATSFLNRATNLYLDGVVEDNVNWAPGVVVGWQGDTFRTTTDLRGRFRLPVTGRHSQLIANKPAHRISLLRGNKSPFEVRLVPLPNEDNESYSWISPHRDTAKLENCANCHGEIYREWSMSAHARSATNPKFLSLYAGTNGNSPPFKTWNAKEEHPSGDGVCALCHVPTLGTPGNAATPLFPDIRNADGVHKSGVHCDYCHKVNDAPTGKFGTRFGRDALELLRPRRGDSITFGPLDDAVRAGESFAYSPIYKRSEYCASCHEGVVFGVHAYGTYSEWLESPAKRQGKQCQTCHMAPTGHLTNIAPGSGGVERNPFTLASHGTPGGELSMLRKAVSLQMRVKSEPRGRVVEIDVTAKNVGHRVPTGFPDRQLLLVVSAVDVNSKEVALQEGPRLPASTGDHAGRAGALFAKQLTSEKGRSPIPFWIHVDKLEDTRLLPDASERRSFVFPANAVRVTAQLWYRRFWHEVAESRGWKDNDVLVCELSN